MNTDVSLSSPQKAAAILVAMNKEQAKKILNQFDPKDIRALMLASQGLKRVTQDVLDTLVDEFENECSRGGEFLDSSDSIQSLIEESLTPEQVTELTVGPEAAQIALSKVPIWELLENVDEDKLIQFLIEENLDVAGYMLTRLPPKKAAALIGKLESGPRQGIVARMITSRPAIPEAVEMLEELVKDEFGRAIGVKKSSGSQRLVAGMLNELDRDLTERLFEDLAGVVKPTNLRSVRSLMFRFEDIVSLESAARSTIFDQLSTDLTTMALRNADPELIESVLSALGQRTRRMLEAELDTESSATAEDIKDAQKEIASKVLSLASEGVITIPTPDAE